MDLLLLCLTAFFVNLLGKHDDFYSDIVNFSFLDGDVFLRASYGVDTTYFVCNSVKSCDWF